MTPYYSDDLVTIYHGDARALTPHVLYGEQPGCVVVDPPCALCSHSGLDVESRIVADESPLGYHREPRCVDTEACEGRSTEREEKL